MPSEETNHQRAFAKQVSRCDLNMVLVEQTKLRSAVPYLQRTAFDPGGLQLRRSPMHGLDCFVRYVKWRRARFEVLPELVETILKLCHCDHPLHYAIYRQRLLDATLAHKLQAGGGRQAGAAFETWDRTACYLPGTSVPLATYVLWYEVSEDCMSLRNCRDSASVVAVLIVFLLVSNSAFAQKNSVDERIRRIEANVASIPMAEGQPPLQLNLQQMMETLKVPGVSVAVIDNFKIAWTKTYGVAETGTSKPVTPTTLFQAGSISKPVAATAALYLVEHGKLSLDENVNNELKIWKVPDNEFTATEKVTLRRILSHTGGLTVHGFPGYAVGEPVPTVEQVLNGEKPANTAPVRVNLVPGSEVRYSGGGVTIEQLLITDVTGKPFPQFMHDTVLAPIGMTNSTYQQPLPASLASSAASGTRAGGTVVPGKWHIYPEMAAAGLWTTPTDLAKFAIEIALSRNGKSNRVLSEGMVRRMLSVQKDDVGLGFFLDVRGNPNAFGHDGSDEGFQALLIMISDTGQGAAIMTNSDRGIELANYLEDSIAREYGWKFAEQKPNAAGPLMLLAEIKGPQAAMDEYHYLRANAASQYKFDEDTLIRLGYHVLMQGKTTDAIQVFKLEVKDYPRFWNAYDSLGEAYMKAGQKELAIENYNKSLELNPKNDNGVEMLKKLKEQK